MSNNKRPRTTEEAVKVMRNIEKEMARERIKRRKKAVDDHMVKWRDDLTLGERMMGLLFMNIHFDGECPKMSEPLCSLIERCLPEEDESIIEKYTKEVDDALFTAVNNFLCLKQ